eukprot:jgi/Botrbrau1/4899/Bobra.118_1s0013.1
MIEYKVDKEELHFLILHQLYQSCPEAAAVLEKEATDRGLLPYRTDIFGNRHELSYADLQKRYAHVPPTGLQQLLRQSLELGTGDGATTSATSLLDGDFFPPCGQTEPGAGRYASQRGRQLSLAQRIFDQATSIPTLRVPPAHLLQAADVPARMQHQRSTRGHRFAVYCIAFDKTGRRIITGSDDRLVKIWSSATALLLASCRGHEGEVTDLAVNSMSSVVASANNDTTIRCWSLKELSVGHPVSVLVGHTAPVSYVDFSRALPDVLLSTSFDGTCRIWNVQDTQGQAMHVLSATPTLESLALPRSSRLGRSSTPASLLLGTAQPPPHDGTHVGVPAGPSGQSTGMQLRHATLSNLPGAAQSRAQDVDAGSDAGASTDAAPEALELKVCSFSPDGRYVFAGASDHTIHVWQWDLEKKDDVVMIDVDDTEVIRLGEAGIIDMEEAARRKLTLLGRLSGHTGEVHLLSVSPDGEQLITGSKDGTVRTWQHEQRRGPGGRPVQTWTAGLTLSCALDEEFVNAIRRRRKAIPSPSVNQVAWNNDGSKILAAITDNTLRVWDSKTGQQLHMLKVHTAPVFVLECHPLTPHLAMSASYDGLTVVWDISKGVDIARFSAKDTRPGDDPWANVIQLVDGHWTPDGEGLAVSDVAGQFHLYGLGSAELMAYARYDQFFSSDYRPVQNDGNGRVLDEETGTEAHIRSDRDVLVDFLGDPYPQAYQQAFRERRVTRLALVDAQAECEGDATAVPQTLPHALLLEPPTLTSAAWLAQEEGGSEEAQAQAMRRAAESELQAEMLLSNRFHPRAQPALDVDAILAANMLEMEAMALPNFDVNMVESEEDDDVSLSSSELADGQDQGSASAEDSDFDFRSQGQRARQARRRVTGGPAHGTQNRGRRVVSERSRRTQQPRGEPERPARSARLRRRAAQRRAREETAGREGLRKRRRLHYNAEVSDVEMSLSEDAVASEDEESEGSDGESLEGAQHAPGRQAGGRRDQEPRQRRGQQAYVKGKGRSPKAYSWLQETDSLPEMYVPQMGDDVVYIVQGHVAYLQSLNQDLPRNRNSLRPAEPALVVGLTYRIVDDEQGSTTAVLKLRLTDCATPQHGREFVVELPPPHYGHPEFVFLKCRFDAAIKKGWKVGDRCQIYYTELDSSERASAYKATITKDGWLGRENEVLQNPYGCGNLWERYTVLWDPPEVGSSTASEEISEHSPWEIFEVGQTAEAVRGEACTLDDQLVVRTMMAVEQALADPKYELFVKSPGPRESHPGPNREVVYYNSVVALPLGLESVMERLTSGYYRQAAAVLHDISTIAKNATEYNGQGTEIADEAQELERTLRAAVQEGNEVEDVHHDEDLSEADDIAMEATETGSNLQWQQRRRIRRSGRPRAPAEQGQEDDATEPAEGGPASRATGRLRRPTASMSPSSAQPGPSAPPVAVREAMPARGPSVRLNWSRQPASIALQSQSPSSNQVSHPATAPPRSINTEALRGGTPAAEPSERRSSRMQRPLSRYSPPLEATYRRVQHHPSPEADPAAESEHVYSTRSRCEVLQEVQPTEDTQTASARVSSERRSTQRAGSSPWVNDDNDARGTRRRGHRTAPHFEPEGTVGLDGNENGSLGARRSLRSAHPPDQPGNDSFNEAEGTRHGGRQPPRRRLGPESPSAPQALPNGGGEHTGRRVRRGSEHAENHHLAVKEEDDSDGSPHPQATEPPPRRLTLKVNLRRTHGAAEMSTPPVTQGRSSEGLEGTAGLRRGGRARTREPEPAPSEMRRSQRVPVPNRRVADLSTDGSEEWAGMPAGGSAPGRLTVRLPRRENA